MSEITLEDRKGSADKIVKYIQNEFSTIALSEQTIKTIYNYGVRDILDAIEIYADENPQHRTVLLALYSELENWKLP